MLLWSALLLFFMNKFLITLYVCGVGLASCSKSSLPPEPDNPPVTPPPPTETFNYKSDHPYNLNVVYFVPNDVVEPADYHRRLSEILLDAQSFVAKEMQRNDYGPKTFGLLKDDLKKRIKLIVIKASRGGSAYPYEGGAGAVINEINAYRSAHASEFSGDHYLVILPATRYDANGEPGGVPFYGLGKFCFALDYADQDVKWLGTSGTLGNRATGWIGGMIHELGHGLNLPHNRQKVSEEPLWGMALMWAGNSTWGRSKTFLTAADCAVLNVNQVFSKERKSFYGEVESRINRIHAAYDTTKGTIVVSGNFSTDTEVTDILCFNDPNVNNEGTGVNRDYNSIAWTTRPAAADSFYLEMPISELVYRQNEEYELKVKLVHVNGVVNETIYSYRFENGIPLLNFSTRNELDKTGWRIESVSSEETVNENGASTNLLDGDRGSYWHSRWSSDAAVYPHEILIHTGNSIQAKGISITQRQSLSRAVKDLEVLVSKDGVNYQPLLTMQLAKSTGPQFFDFGQVQEFRYLKLLAKSSWDGEKFAALAEIGLY